MMVFDVSERSSNISQIGYDPLNESLRILFKSGIEYAYSNFSSRMLRDFMDSESLGKHFNNKIKDQFKTTKMGTTQSEKLKMLALIRSVERHKFMCQAGPLEKCQDWLDLRAVLLNV